MKTQEALKLALEALKEIAQGASSDFEDAWCGAIAENVLPAIREALADQPAQEKAGHTFYDGNGNVVAHLDATAEITMDYSKPSAWAQRKPWVGLTDEEVKHQWEIWRANISCYAGFARGLEAKLREKNT